MKEDGKISSFLSIIMLYTNVFIYLKDAVICFNKIELMICI